MRLKQDLMPQTSINDFPTKKFTADLGIHRIHVDQFKSTPFLSQTFFKGTLVACNLQWASGHNLPAEQDVTEQTSDTGSQLKSEDVCNGDVNKSVAFRISQTMQLLVTITFLELPGAMLLHHVTAKLLLLTRQVQPDMQLPTSFL